MKKDQLPLGFAMSPVINPDAMQKFATISEDQKKIIEGTHAVKSRDGIHRCVDSLAKDKQ